jgi:hypothetical protein
MATIRRLSDADVRAIFESLHGNLPPPPHLRFKIVPVGPNGQKWSPPPYEFEGTIQWSSSRSIRSHSIPFKPKPSSYSDLQMAFTSYSSQKRNERI